MPVMFVEDSSLKSLREIICASRSTRFSDLIRQIDKHRPLGPDGKHGDRHTKHCGCEDK